MDTLKILCLFLTLTGALMIISYGGIAKSRGWKVGNYFHVDNTSWVKIIGFLLMISSGYFAFKYYSWWQGLLLIFAAWFSAYILTFVLKSMTQLVSILILLSGVILYFISFSEVTYGR